MTATPTPDSRVRVRLKCADAKDFVERFAPNVTRGGIFLPTREARDVGTSIRFELALQDDTLVFAGEGVVTWVKPKGMGVKFTNLDPATAPMLERLLTRRQTAAAAPERPAPQAATPAAAAPVASAVAERATPAAAAPVLSAAAQQARPAPPPERPTGAAVQAADSEPTWLPPPDRSRSLVRAAVALAVMVVGVVAVSVSVGRARRPAAVAFAPAPVAPPAVAIVPPPPVAAPEPTSETPAPAPEAAPPPNEAAASPPASEAAESPPASTRSGGLQVDEMLVGASYKRFTCPNPTKRLSVKASRSVNVCLRVAHRPGKAERLTLIWERNGSLSGKTRLTIPASRTDFRTRAKMRISAKRLGAWSVRVVSDRNAPLAETTFDVVP